MITNVAAIFIGGGIGAILRYFTSVFCTKYFNTILPVATLTVNFVGCLLIGMIIAYFMSKTDFHPATKASLTVGLCGGLSTLSTFSYEVLYLFEKDNYFIGIMYIIATIIICLMATFLGLKIGKFL